MTPSVRPSRLLASTPGAWIIPEQAWAASLEILSLCEHRKRRTSKASNLEDLWRKVEGKRGLLPLGSWAITSSSLLGGHRDEQENRWGRQEEQSEGVPEGHSRSKCGRERL